MTISPARNGIFHGTDPVAGAVRTSLSITAALPHADHQPEAPVRAGGPMNLQALYPALFPAPQPVRRRWSLRRLAPQH